MQTKKQGKTYSPGEIATAALNVVGALLCVGCFALAIYIPLI